MNSPASMVVLARLLLHVDIPLALTVLKFQAREEIYDGGAPGAVSCTQDVAAPWFELSLLRCVICARQQANYCLCEDVRDVQCFW